MSSVIVAVSRITVVAVFVAGTVFFLIRSVIIITVVHIVILITAVDLFDGCLEFFVVVSVIGVVVVVCWLFVEDPFTDLTLGADRSNRHIVWMNRLKILKPMMVVMMVRVVMMVIVMVKVT